MNKEDFVCNSDEGRFKVYSPRTGKTYYVEAIGEPHVNWGDINPATKKVEGNYGSKYKGSISISESVITKENGFNDIIDLGVGESPLSKIEELDSKHPTI